MAEKKATPEQGAESVKPYDNGAEKGKQVEEMFDAIAPAYDFMNTAMSFGLHRHWRNVALREAFSRLESEKHDGLNILDVATGTGDLVFSLHKRLPSSCITGIDLSKGMLARGEERLSRLPAAERQLIDFCQGDCLALPFEDNTFEMVTVAYGVRNFAAIERGLREMQRVLRHGGVICIVELSVPESRLPRWGYSLYTKHIIPALGRFISGDRRAYTYLPESIAAAPQRGALTSLMQQAGFRHSRWRSLTMGVVTIYTAQK